MSMTLSITISHARTYLAYMTDAPPYPEVVRSLKDVIKALETPHPDFDPEGALAVFRKIRAGILERHPEAKPIGKDATGSPPDPRQDTVPQDTYRIVRAIDDTMQAIRVAKVQGAFDPPEESPGRRIGVRESRELQRRKDRIAKRPIVDGTEGIGDGATAVPSEMRLEDAQDIFCVIQANQMNGFSKQNTLDTVTRALSFVHAANLEYQKTPMWDGCKPVPLAASWIKYAEMLLSYLLRKHYLKGAQGHYYETFSFDTKFP